MPGLASCPKARRGALTRLLVLGAMTAGNSAQLERDMKSIREVFDKRTRKLDASKVCQQCRLALNFSSRSIEKHVQAAVRRWSSEEHEKDSRKRKERSDRGQAHRKRARGLPSHLTQSDRDALQGGLNAVFDVLVDDSEDEGEGVHASENFLSGVSFTCE